MKKLTLFIISLFFVSAVNLFAFSFDYLSSGEYAFYNDNRGGLDFLRGYLYVRTAQNECVFYSRNVRRSDDLEIIFQITVVEDTEGDFQIKDIQSQSTGKAPDSKEELAEFQQGILDMLNFHEFYIKHKNEIEWDCSLEDEWPEFGYTLLYHYNVFYPMFRFDSLTKKGDKEASYTLNYAGVFSTEEDVVSFFNMKGISFEEAEVSRGVPNLSIPKSKAKKISLNGVDITVDESWEEADFEGNKSYFLKVFSVRDSQFMVEVIPDEMLNVVTWESLVRFMMLYNLTDYNSIVCERKKDFLQVSFALYDENGYKNYQYMIVPDKKDKILVNFSTFADIFDANKSYYQKILKSIKKSK